MTEHWEVPPVFDPSHPLIVRAARLIREGKRVAFPTETVYGLGADAFSTEAVEGIFRAKGRPADNPLIVHIAEMTQLNVLIERADETSYHLMERYWPGPLTLVLPMKKGAVSSRVTAGLSTVAVRMPDHPVALGLIVASGCPLAVPSANRSGKPSATRVEHVLADLDGLIEVILDGGPCGVGVESTVIEVREGIVHILRPGGITREELCMSGFAVMNEGVHGVEFRDTETPKAPGMKYKHYAPKGQMTVVKGSDMAAVMGRIQAESDTAGKHGHMTGILTFTENIDYYCANLVLSYGGIADVGENARLLYDALRVFDDAGVTHIMAEACREDGIGFAIMNRLLKAAGHNLLTI